MDGWRPVLCRSLNLGCLWLRQCCATVGFRTPRHWQSQWHPTLRTSCDRALAHLSFWQLYFVAAVFLVAGAALSGCSHSDHPKTVPVSGRVTIGGKPPPRPGLLSFATLEPAEGFPGRPAAGSFDTSGNYSAGIFPGEGVIPGKYRVAVECWTKPYSGDGPKPPSHVPEKYRSVATSDVELTIAPGDSAKTFNIDLPAN
jgi:hypothetical protein